MEEEKNTEKTPVAEKKQFFGGRLETIEDCEKAIVDAHWFLLAMAGLMLVLGTLLGQFVKLLPDVIFMAVIALVLKKYQSRTVATLVFLYSIGICIVTFGNKLNMAFAKDFGGGTNIFLAILFVYVAYKTMIAAFKIFKFKNYAVSWKNFFIKTVIFIVLFVATLFVSLILAIFIKDTMLLGLLSSALMLLAAFVSYAGFFPMSDKLKIKYVKEA